MNDNFYKQFIEKSQIGYAYHKIICNEDGLICDFKFIEVNAAFEKLTGLLRSDIVGENITTILPDIKKGKFDWIQLYGDIAINGGQKDFKQFFESLKRWYNIVIYSPEKYYFITSFTDITKEMNQLSEMERLISVSEEFLQINEQKIDYQKITDDFSKMCGAKYAAFNLFDKDGKVFTTTAISGDKGLLRKASKMLGFKPENKKWKYEIVYDKNTNIGTITHFYSFKELVGNFIPIPLAVLIEKALNLGEVIRIKILKENIMLGDFMLFMKKGDQFNKDTFAELYTRQLGMLITRKRAEDAFLNEKILTDAIFNTSPGMIYLYDDEGRLIQWNKKHEDITGYTSA